MEQQASRAARAQPGQDPTEILSLIKKIENLLRELSSTPSAARPSADNVPATLVSQRQHAVSAAGIPKSERGRARKFTNQARPFPKFGPKRKRVTSGKKRTAFTDLPGELRNIIYGYALVLDRPIDLWPRAHPYEHKNYARKMRERTLRDVRKKLAVGLLRVSKLISSEAAPVFYGLNSFTFAHQDGWMVLEALLYTIGPINRKLITDIKVCFSERRGRPSYRRERNWMEDRLHEMHLHIPCHDTQIRKYWPQNTWECPEDWESFAKLDTMRVLGKDGTLKKLSILWYCLRLTELCAPDDLEYFNNLKAGNPDLQISVVFSDDYSCTWTYAEEYKQGKIDEALGYGWNVSVEVRDESKLDMRW